MKKKSVINQISQTKCKICNKILILKNEKIDDITYPTSKDGIMTLVGDNEYEWFCYDCYNELLNGVKINPLNILKELDEELDKLKKEVDEDGEKK